MSPEVVQRLNILRAKSNDGTITTQEYQEAIRLMRADRVSAQHASANSTARKKAPKAEIKSADEMLDELGKI